ncbi:LysR family transcriptional regulator [Marinobacter sp.]|uniref:LysR family transcriptional regulator n=1 Tax=Marinobacter sp. TaxID=50741 RepID=UPI0019A8DE9C|nr:LysR family transcriptional regulator [Marinobacter sp.]MBC7191803.1 LysR family transcriptional regulator [Marinobacter sp.]
MTKPKSDPDKIGKYSTAVPAKSRPMLRSQRILVYVNAVARCGSIRKAADSLHMASSALNRRLLDLEEEVGTSLFERLPRGVRLTAAGEIYISYVRRVLADTELVGSQIERLRGLVRGHVKVAATESVAGNLLPDAVATFQADHPGVYFNITIVAAEKLVDMVTSDTVDLILTHELYDRDDLIVLASVPQPFCAVVRKSHPLVEKNNLRLRDCLPYPVALGDETMAGRTFIDRALHKASFTLEPVLVSNSIKVMHEFARLSGGIYFQFRIGTMAANSDMVVIPLNDRVLTQGKLHLAMRRDRVLPVASAAFYEHLAGILQTI